MSMALFPYIYLLAKAQLATMGVSLFKAAKTLGNTNYQAIKIEKTASNYHHPTIMGATGGVLCGKTGCFCIVFASFCRSICK